MYASTLTDVIRIQSVLQYSDNLLIIFVFDGVASNFSLKMSHFPRGNSPKLGDIDDITSSYMLLRISGAMKNKKCRSNKKKTSSDSGT